MNNRNKRPAGYKTSSARPSVAKETPVQYVKGVGPGRARLLARLGIETIEDLLFYFPWRYEDRKNLKKIHELRYGEVETTAAEVISADIVTTPKKKMKIFELTLTDHTGYLKAKWFNQPYLKKYFRKDQRVIVNGTVKGNPYSRAGLEMENPDFELLENEDDLVHTSRIVPVYKVTEGISAKQMRSLMYNAVRTNHTLIEDYLPDAIMQRNNLKPLPWAVSEAHFPEEIEDQLELNNGKSPAHQRLIFDEFFLLELGMAVMKQRETRQKGISFERKDDMLAARFFSRMPFALTAAQQRVIRQISEDMQSPLPMNRLVHGDVGCGKTIVALAAMLTAIENGYQACLMAPTEILAEQHYMNIHRMVAPLALEVQLLTSSTRDGAVDAIARGDARLIIGTHSLIQEQVHFDRLGVAVIDEQHRFGVMQRAMMRRKGINPDILIMTATPIPRTLAMTLYGDLDVSVIDELPAGRKPVVTKVFFQSQKDRIIQLIRDELEKGRQAYIVYPLIEESEKLDLKSAIEGAEAFRKIFPSKRIGLVHGRMHTAERETVMQSFKEGETDVLVATTVIEVGIDVPNASLMLIVHTERFGLAQLHQLRGRIGRGAYDSFCLLLAYPPFSEEARSRLKAMESTHDGFRIAEADLSIRGPGDFFGTRQSGIPDLKLANIVRDVNILEAARKEAFAFMEMKPDLKQYPLLFDVLQKKWMGKLDLMKS